MLAGSYYPGEFKDWPPLLYWLMGTVTVIMLFVSILLHEFGHSVLALRYGIPVRSITLFFFGGVAQIGAEPPTARVEFLIAIAGPLVSLVLAVLFYTVQPLVAGLEPAWGLAKYLAYSNLALVLFNLMPGYPLDGGRVFRSIVWGITGNRRRATIIAANVGRCFAVLMIFVGVWQMFSGNIGGGLWIAFIGWFLDNTASTQVRQVTFQGLPAGHRVSQVMNKRFAALPAGPTPQPLIDERTLDSGQHCELLAGSAGLATLRLDGFTHLALREGQTARALHDGSVRE
jgi:Zn-dependent protease